MRICAGLLCERTAKVWMRGKPWCIPCSIKRFGIVAPQSGAAPRGGDEPGTSRSPAAAVLPASSSGRARSSSGDGREARSGLRNPDVGPAGPSFDDPLVALLEENGWDVLDIELELISLLEGELGW